MPRGERSSRKNEPPERWKRPRAESRCNKQDSVGFSTCRVRCAFHERTRMDRIERTVTLRLDGQGESALIQVSFSEGVVSIGVESFKIGNPRSTDFFNASEFRTFVNELVRLAEFAEVDEAKDEAE